ncbi:hypothetical protein COB21_04240 [Candidatus Aerophobetes bacterium]|uniref:Uncharacterized protein n=1 Tax=Aerophobetes bacterium TaxID=2030807 RepID=A0A2A4X210_UNCAE|nr:MAG: hypothetical protein COB21_04240 [Candidatus Aerophobetes bacterium]
MSTESTGRSDHGVRSGTPPHQEAGEHERATEKVFQATKDAAKTVASFVYNHGWSFATYSVGKVRQGLDKVYFQRQEGFENLKNDYTALSDQYRKNEHLSGDSIREFLKQANDEVTETMWATAGLALVANLTIQVACSFFGWVPGVGLCLGYVNKTVLGVAAVAGYELLMAKKALASASSYILRASDDFENDRNQEFVKGVVVRIIDSYEAHSMVGSIAPAMQKIIEMGEQFWIKRNFDVSEADQGFMATAKRVFNRVTGTPDRDPNNGSLRGRSRSRLHHNE